MSWELSPQYLTKPSLVRILPKISLNLGTVFSGLIWPVFQADSLDLQSVVEITLLFRIAYNQAPLCKTSTLTI